MAKRSMKIKKTSKAEFTKIIVMIVIICGISWVQQSYILSFMNKDTNTDVTVSVVSFLLALVINGYFFKSFSEKNSRNKYGIEEEDEDEKENDVNGTE